MSHTAFASPCGDVNTLYDHRGRPKNVGTEMARHFSVAGESRNAVAEDVESSLITMGSSMKEGCYLHMAWRTIDVPRCGSSSRERRFSARSRSKCQEDASVAARSDGNGWVLDDECEGIEEV